MKYAVLTVGVLTMLGLGLARGQEMPPLLLVSARSGNPEIFLVNVAKGEVKSLTRNKARNTFPAWSHDGRKIAFSSNRDGANNIYIMDANGKNVTQLTHEKPAAGQDCNAATFSPDGRQIAFCRRDKKAEIVVMAADGSGQKVIATDAYDPAWSPDGRHIAFTSNHKRIGFRLCLMDPDGDNVRELAPEDNTLGYTYAAWSPDSRQIAYADASNGHLEIFLIAADGSERRQLTYLRFLNTYPTWSPDGKQIIFIHVEPQGSGYMFVNADGTRLRVSPLTKLEMPQKDFRPAFQYLASAGPKQHENRDIQQVVHREKEESAESIVLVERVTGHSGPISIARFSPNGRHLASMGEDGNAVLWDVERAGLRPRAVLSGHEGEITDGAWSADGKTIATASTDKTVRIWDVSTQLCEATLSEHTEAVHAVAFSKDGNFLVTADANGTVIIRDTDEYKPRFTLELNPGEETPVSALCISPDGKMVVAGGGDWDEPKEEGVVTAWELSTGKKLWSIAKNLGGISGLIFTADGKTLAGASLDGTVRLWDPATGHEKVVVKGHTDRVIGVACAPDGKTLATASFDHSVRLWDAATGRQKSILAGHVAPAARVAFSPDGKLLSSTGLDGFICLWRLQD